MIKIRETGINYLHLIVLPLLAFTLLAGYIYVPSVNAETDDILDNKLFSTSEKVRTEVNFVFSYPTNNLHIIVSVKQTSFNTGEIITNSYEFEDPSLNSKYQLGERKLTGSSFLTPSGQKSYVDVKAFDKDNYLGSTIFEFDLGSKQLKKIMDSNQKLSARVYGSLGIYETFSDLPEKGYPGTDKHQLYSIQTNKPILPQGKYGIIEEIPLQKNPGPGPFAAMDNMTTGKAYSDKGVDKNYLLSYGGKLTPMSKIYNMFIYDEVKRIMTLELQNKNGQLQLEHISKSGQEYTKITWIKGSTKKTLLDVPGYINEFSTPSISLNNRYMIISSQIRGDHLAFVDATYYVFDLKTMSLIQKIKPHYKLYEYKIEWFNDELVRISYDTSRPNKYPPVYYHFPTQTSTASRELLEYVSYLDNFTYDGLLSLDAPISLRVDNQYIRYSGNGPFFEKDKLFVPLRDFAEQQVITVDISATEIKLTKKDKQTSIDIKNAKEIGDVWYVPLRDLIPLNYKILEKNDSYINMETVKDGEV